MLSVVLGAGIAGVTAAYELARRGHEVIVVDRQSAPALETSYANGGLIVPSQSDPWASPDAPMKLLKWLGREDAPLLLRLSAVPGMLRWGLAFLANCRHTRSRARPASSTAVGTGERSGSTATRLRSRRDSRSSSPIASSAWLTRF